MGINEGLSVARRIETEGCHEKRRLRLASQTKLVGKRNRGKKVNVTGRGVGVEDHRFPTNAAEKGGVSNGH